MWSRVLSRPSTHVSVFKKPFYAQSSLRNHSANPNPTPPTITTGPSSVVDKELHHIFRSLAADSADFIPRAELEKELISSGMHSALTAPALSMLASEAPQGRVTWDTFRSLIKSSPTDHVERALTGKLAIPDFKNFTEELQQIFNTVRVIETGTQADYIPQLARVNADHFALAVCTIDGQIWATGDSANEFTIQSCSKPVSYSLALAEHGTAKVHQHVGYEPSGRQFNAYVLNDAGLPHNPMINSGAIMTSSLIRPGLEASDRFDHVLRTWWALASDTRVGFDHATYLSELKHADRNFALAYMMKERKAFPEGSDVTATLELYFQQCSITLNASQLAQAAAVFANGGVNPITEKRIFSPEIVCNCLALMLSCGMYDYSGTFAFTIGLPAKSGVSGAVMIVVPNVMGIAVWSPRLDPQGNSVRGIEFCRHLLEKYNFHIFDAAHAGRGRWGSLPQQTLLAANYLQGPGGTSPSARRSNPPNITKNSTKGGDVAQSPLMQAANMCFAASSGSLAHLRRMLAQGIDVNMADYDQRTALHLAAAEGHGTCVQYLLGRGANPLQQDRWGRTPLDEARRGNHAHIADMLEGRAGQPKEGRVGA